MSRRPRTNPPLQRWHRTALAALLGGACSAGPPSTDAHATPPRQAPRCAPYCQLAQLRCAAHLPLYASAAACAAACAALPGLGTIGEVSGDTLGCRMTYLLLADIAPARFCPHAGASGGSMCVGPAAADAAEP